MLSKLLNEGTLLAWGGMVLITALAFSRMVAEILKGKGVGKR